MLPLYGCDVVWRLDAADEASVDATLFACDANLHDEDNDDFPDACDRCPGIADDQADQDQDGVGDACDPSSSVMHEIALFVSFSDGSPAWRQHTGSWVQRDDALVYESYAQTTYGVSIYPGIVPEPPYVLEAHVAVDPIEAVVSVLAMAVDTNADGDGVTCGFTRRLSPLRDVVRTQDVAGTPADEKPIAAITAGGYRLTMSYDRASSQCAIAADDKSTGGATMVDLDTAPAPGELSFRSLRVGASVQYLTFYKPR
jgi:hypothetical protein